MKLVDIRIELDKDVVVLATHDLGKEIFNTQVKPYLEKGCKYNIYFPERVINVSISFVIGFRDALAEIADVNKAVNKFTIKGNEYFIERFWRGWYF